jgi:hypothetical protein
MDNNQPYKTGKSKDKILNIYHENYPQDPREWDNLGKMICTHKRYNLGDKHTFNFDNHDSWDEVEKAIKREYNIAVILPLFLYDHSGITMRTTSFNDRWDSGQVGFIIATKENVREQYSVKRISPKLAEKIKGYLINEVETYDQYLTGEVYRFEVTDLNGVELDSCGGFFGADFKMNGLTDYIDKELIDSLT